MHTNLQAVDGARISQLRATKFEGTEDDWAGVLRWALFRQGSSKANGSRVELVAQVSETTLSLVLRQRLEGGITSRFGSIQLQRNTRLEDEIELFEWAGLAAKSAHAGQSDLDALKAQLEQRTLECERLKDQLQDLVEAKKEHERTMLEKFRQLLNSKKIKIRDQQRLLTGAKIDANAVARLANATEAQARGRQPLPSRTAKRKAEAGDMDIDKADDDDADEDEVQVATSQSNDSGSEDERLQSREQGNATLPSPPRRELPFTASRSTAQPVSQPVSSTTKQDLDSDGETDDDEL